MFRVIRDISKLRKQGRKLLHLLFLRLLLLRNHIKPRPLRHLLRWLEHLLHALSRLLVKHSLDDKNQPLHRIISKNLYQTRNKDQALTSDRVYSEQVC